MAACSEASKMATDRIHDKSVSLVERLVPDRGGGGCCHGGLAACGSAAERWGLPV